MKEYTVSALNNYIKRMLDNDLVLRNIVVAGEVSNCTYHGSGHIYFTIKDTASALSCMMYKSKRENGLKFKLETGMQVVVSGNVSVFERDGRYQLYANSIKAVVDEKGKLYEEYEKLKVKLYEEGLFDFEIKKPIPAHPKAVGIVTAPTGAAIQDIINISKRRNPYVQLYLYPAKVQGDGAAATIVKGIEALDKMGLDTIIIGRGGGSIEDLWAFNEEIVARAIYAAKTPIISGTGHEVDNTIADYAADLRAPTPSAAAELAIDNVVDTINKVNNLNDSIRRGFMFRYNEIKYRYSDLRNNLERLKPEATLRSKQFDLEKLTDRLHQLMSDKLSKTKHRLTVDIERLNGLSPTAKLINGFGYISHDGNPVMGVADVKSGDKLEIIMHDGTVSATVE